MNMNTKKDGKSTNNNYTPERARLSVAHNLIVHSDDANYVETALTRLGETLKKLREDRGWKNSTMLEHLDVMHFQRPEQFGRIIDNKWSKRPPTAGQMFELRSVFGISLVAVAVGENPFVIEQMSDARLIELMELLSAELSRRIRQK